MRLTKEHRLASLVLRVCVVVAVGAITAVYSLPQSTPTRALAVEAIPVPLNPQDPSQNAIGDFVYAGGLQLRANQSDRFHGLSDLEVLRSDRLVAVSDDGDVVEARLVFDAMQRLVGVADVRIGALLGEDGRPLREKADADAEGLAILPNGARLVSFERHHRILRYPAIGGLPRGVPSPSESLPPNEGLEALSVDPEAGADAYIAGAEASGDTWRCRLSSRCTAGPTVAKSQEFGLVSMKRIRGLDTAYLLRAFDAERGSRISLELFRSGRQIANLEMATPLTVDNYEGVAAVPRSDGSVRFYLLSDDNGSDRQRTLLLAFDWRP
jgi:hypothetical protein